MHTADIFNGIHHLIGAAVAPVPGAKYQGNKKVWISPLNGRGWAGWHECRRVGKVIHYHGVPVVMATGVKGPMTVVIVAVLTGDVLGQGITGKLAWEQFRRTAARLYREPGPNGLDLAGELTYLTIRKARGAAQGAKDTLAPYVAPSKETYQKVGRVA